MKLFKTIAIALCASFAISQTSVCLNKEGIKQLAAGTLSLANWVYDFAKMVGFGGAAGYLAYELLLQGKDVEPGLKGQLFLIALSAKLCREGARDYWSFAKDNFDF